MVLRFKRRFGDDVAVLHSLGTVNDEWQSKTVEPGVGARSALLKFRNYHYR